MFSVENPDGRTCTAESIDTLVSEIRSAENWSGGPFVVTDRSGARVGTIEKLTDHWGAHLDTRFRPDQVAVSA